MTSNIVICETTECVHCTQRECRTTDIWINSDHQCDSYEVAEDEQEPSFVGPVED